MIRSLISLGLKPVPVHQAARARFSALTRRPPFKPEAAFQLTGQPHPEWRLGEGQSADAPLVLGRQWKEDEREGWREIDMESVDKIYTYKLMTSAIVPRPIAFVSSISSSGVHNLAPFSYFSMVQSSSSDWVAHDPALLSVSFSISPRKQKDTEQNIKATKEFVVNIISEPFVEAANACSVEAPADIDEWVLSGLTKEPSKLVRPPRVLESAISFECELFDHLDIKASSSDRIGTCLVLGRIKYAHIRNAVMTEDGLVDASKLRAVSRLGGIMYARVGEGFEISRPSWKAIQAGAEALEGSKSNS